MFSRGENVDLTKFLDILAKSFFPRVNCDVHIVFTSIFLYQK